MKALNFTLLISFLVNITYSQETKSIFIKQISILREKDDFLFLKMELFNPNDASITIPNSNTKISFSMLKIIPDSLKQFESQIVKQLQNEKFSIESNQTINWYLKISKSINSQISEQQNVDNQLKRNSNTNEEVKYSIEDCPDLLITEYKIAKSTQNYIWLEFTIVNRGRKSANVFHTDNEFRNHFLVKALLSTSYELSKVYWDAGSKIIDKGLRARNGIINPQESYTDLIKIDLEGKTKFHKYIILQLDPYLLVPDCNRTNNNLTIQLKNN